MTIGNRISELRKSKGYTQEYLAEMLGVSRQAVSKWEQDISSPDTKNMIALADLLDTSVEYMIKGKTKDEHNDSRKIIKVLNECCMLFFLLAVVIHFLGILTGAYTRMVSIGLLGIPWLYYGTSTEAIAYMVLTAMFLMIAGILLIVKYRMKKNDSE